MGGRGGINVRLLEKHDLISPFTRLDIFYHINYVKQYINVVLQAQLK